jgi:hypothetical protein
MFYSQNSLTTGDNFMEVKTISEQLMELWARTFRGLRISQR